MDKYEKEQVMARVFELREQGILWREICEELNISRATAITYWKTVSQASWLSITEEFKALRAKQLAELEALQQSYWDMAIAGDYRAAEIVLSVKERIARITGMDAPYKVAVLQQADNKINVIVSNDWRNPTQTLESNLLPAAKEESKISIIDVSDVDYDITGSENEHE
jgi:transcriptional regulator